MDYDVSGRDHSNPKNSRKYCQMFKCSARVQEVCLPDICFYIVNKVVKQDLKMTKIWVKFVPKSLT